MAPAYIDLITMSKDPSVLLQLTQRRHGTKLWPSSGSKLEEVPQLTHSTRASQKPNPSQSKPNSYTRDYTLPNHRTVCLRAKYGIRTIHIMICTAYCSFFYFRAVIRAQLLGNEALALRASIATAKEMGTSQVMGSPETIGVPCGDRRCATY
jgi:hypothetical protein